MKVAFLFCNLWNFGRIRAWWCYIKFCALRSLCLLASCNQSRCSEMFIIFLLCFFSVTIRWRSPRVSAPMCQRSIIEEALPLRIRRQRITCCYQVRSEPEVLETSIQKFYDTLLSRANQRTSFIHVSFSIDTNEHILFVICKMVMTDVNYEINWHLLAMKEFAFRNKRRIYTIEKSNVTWKWGFWKGDEDIRISVNLIVRTNILFSL